MNKSKQSQLIKELAYNLGFTSCGIAKADFLEEDASRLDQWLSSGMHGEMAYMANYFDKRLDPRKLVEGAQSVITLLYNYFPDKELPKKSYYKISKYAYGKDYHFVIKKKLKILLQQIQSHIGSIEGRVFVDSAPVMERVWAKKTGIGWIGKNSLLVSPKQGSFFFVAVVITDLPLVYDVPIKDYCGSCTRCIDACPTNAIEKPYVVNGSKCISYYTIELKEQIPQEVSGKFKNWIFGCDICQDVCPWNRFSKPHEEADFLPSDELKEMSKKDWEEITESVFTRMFKGSPVKRTKFKGLQRNIQFVKNKK